MTMLHTVNKSPFEKTSLDSCLRFAQEGSAILLLEDGVYAAMKGTTAEEKMVAAGNRHKIFVLGPDLKARGLAAENLIEGIEMVGYGGFVDLAVAHDNVQSWL
ncbi:MAG: sulfurtransferase complex subunit TusB [Gammaproteobacteria bacterium]|jgi:tRNA 2-thiouridine synthesizing protein B|nr:MAG: sulfurtransferase complex subunit TusB [Gammaproteobacteria bacterium]